MRFLIDECTGPVVAAWLRSAGHDVFSVYDSARGIADDEVMRIAKDQSRILITNDKDFGAKVFREKSPHCGVILLRLSDERAAIKINVLHDLLAAYSDKLRNQFVIVSEERVRFAGTH